MPAVFYLGRDFSMNIKQLLILVGSVLLGLALVSIWLILLSGPPVFTRAASYTVCEAGLPTCDYDSIQSAVDATADGDLVMVATGTYTDVNHYNELGQVVYIDKSITIRGGYTTTNWTTSDPVANPTTLDAEGGGRVLFITGNISPTIEGFRITGGNSSGGYGGGVHIITASATISNCWVFSNTSPTENFGGGGGVYVKDSGTVLLENNTIASNNSTTIGGGLFLDNSDATLINNHILSNSADIGGGVFLDSSDAVLIGNTISSNSAISYTVANYGGGLYIRFSNATLINNTISSNVAKWGGGLYLYESNATIRGNTITTNRADNRGGGLILFYGNPILENNFIVDNIAAGRGDGILIEASSPHLIHNTIAGSDDSSGGDGVYISSSPSSNAVFTNTILVNHSVGIEVSEGTTATLTGTLWGSGVWTNDMDWSGDGTIITGTVNIWGDPSFVAPNTGDYHIEYTSAAIDAGVNAGITTDIDGEPRPFRDGYDIGADEFTGVIPIPIYLPLVQNYWYSSRE
jgi:fibronectin-binding autotransporter adhesin